MDETVGWLRDRPYYHDQIKDHRLMEAQTGAYADLSVNPYLKRALERRDIDQFYQHQATAIEEIRTGNNLVIATPTASGKSLVYTIPAIERALDHEGRTLYIAPLRALINDQEEALSALSDDLGMGARVDVGQYTGQLSRDQKRAVRADQPHIVLMTPDLLHYGVLPNDHLWEWFFRQLDTVVIDEVHEYRGIFGSQIALIMRRLSRMCERYDADPQFICCSATIGNPATHASNVTGQPTDSFTVIGEDTSTTGATHWLFWNPPPATDPSQSTNDDTQDAEDSTTQTVNPEDGSRSEPIPPSVMSSDGGEIRPVPPSESGDGPPPIQSLSSTESAENETSADAGPRPDTGGERLSNHAQSVKLFCDLVTRGYQTLVFTRTRQGAERCANWCAASLHKRGEHETARTVTAYQAALKQERREEIEDGLHDGSIRGVWSTSALELGVDVGGLDVVILDGYPGTRMQTHQRAGRAGRGRDASLVIVVGGRDQLDQYLMGHPDVFFDGDAEQAAINPANDQLLPDHVLSAATESWLSPDDEHHFGEGFPALVSQLEETGELARRSTHEGLRWLYAGDGSPQHEMSIRAIDDREIAIRDRLANTTLASLSYDDALRDVHPGAIYYHQGEKYEVVDLDLQRDTAFLESTTASYYTRALTDKSISVNDVRKETTLAAHPGVALGFADIDFREQVTKYLRCTRGNDDDGDPIPLAEPLPPTELRTRALYFTIPPAIKQNIRAASEEEDGFEGAIHAVEHAMISLFPLEFLCDRRDIGGLSTPLHPGTGRSTIFIYDGYPGGVGLARGGYERVEDLLRQTRELLADCPCESGCPACIQSPHCGNANDPLSKSLALSLLDQLLDDNHHRGSEEANTSIRPEPCEDGENVDQAPPTDDSERPVDTSEERDPEENDEPTPCEDSNHKPAATDESFIVDQIAAEIGVDTDTLAAALDSLTAHDVTPQAAKRSLMEHYRSDGPTVYDVSGVGHVRGHFLVDAGYDPPKELATASPEDLANVPYLGEQTAPKIRAAAQEDIDSGE